MTDKKKPVRSSARPFFRPRVVVKFRDWVDVPYEDGAERHVIEKYGGTIWKRIEERHGAIHLERLYTALAPDRMRKLINEAVERDPNDRPSNLLSRGTSFRRSSSSAASESRSASASAEEPERSREKGDP